MGRLLKCVCASVALCGLGSVAAHADTLDLFSFTLTGSNAVGTATISASPVPSSVTATSFTIASVTATYDGDVFSGPVTFLNAGGVSADGFTFTGPLLFSGSDSAPTFDPGTFALAGTIDIGNGPMPISGDVTISQEASTATTPEPSTLAMVGTAALGMAGALRRRFV